MNLLSEADPVVRQLVPHVLEAAGLKEQACSLRELEPMIEVDVIIYACELLREIQDTAGAARPEEWAAVVEDAAFWGEGALLAAAGGERELFTECFKSLRRVMNTGCRLMAVH